MFTSLKLGKLFGIDTYIHWSFWWLLLWIGISSGMASGWLSGLTAMLFVAVLFGCVYLHELGHALAGRQLGIPTLDITLLPFGGVARMAAIPERPWQEVLIAVAGPAVNVVLAGMLLTGLVLYGGFSLLMEQSPLELPWIEQLCLVNVGLVVFNMIPAFPMDGGRVLRAVLATQWGHLQATEVAARVGRWIALAMIVFGIVMWIPSLALVGLFVWIAGMGELMAVRWRHMQSQVPPRPDYPWQANGRDPWHSSPWDSDRSTIDADEVRPLPK
jgi:Zn-dependent protease